MNLRNSLIILVQLKKCLNGPETVTFETNEDGIEQNFIQ